MRAPESPVERYMSKRILFFAYLMCSSVFRANALKKACMRFAIFSFSEKLQNILEIGFKKIWSDRTKFPLEKKVFRNKKFADTFVFFLYVKLATVHIWEQSNKFPLTCSSCKCPLLVRKWALCKTQSHGTKLYILVSKLRSGTSKTMQLVPVHLDLPLFWKSHCATCSPVYIILYHVTGSCKGPIVSRKQRWKNFPASKTNFAHKHSQLVSQITEPISAWKVYFRWLPGVIFNQLLVFRIAVKAKRIFLAACFFSWSC